jgi:transcriptional regulator with XRE-family HTH domain
MRDLRQVVAGNLRRIRHAKGLSQEELAFRAEIDRSYISQLENGTYAATVVMLGKLAEALDVEPTDFLKIPGKSK